MFICECGCEKRNVAEWCECQSGALPCSFAPSNNAMAVMVRVCEVTHAIETYLLSGVEAAQDFALDKFKIPHSEWESHMVRPDPMSSMELNGKPVVYCGWQCRIDETEKLYIHMDRILTVK